MSQSHTHEAAGQALGYVHQVQWGLIELIQRARKSPTTFLRLETLDDIVTADAEAGIVELTQVKHQVKPAADLTENSVALWRSLNVWMDVLASGAINGTPVLKLVTTASIPEHGILNYLRTDNAIRRIDLVVKTLGKAAKDSENVTTRPWRQKFLKLSTTERTSFLSLVTIEDNSPRARDVADALSETLRFAAPHGHEDAFITSLLGWWYRLCVQLLDRTVGAVSAEDLDVRISDLRDQFLPDNLPIAQDVLVPFTKEDSIPYRDRQFVQQLMWIALDEQRLWLAIRDYHRAWTQRSEWLRLNLICESELDRFAFRLHDEWEHVFHERVAKMRRDNEPNTDITGQEILERVSAESRARVRERFDEGWLNRGCLHALADGWSNRTIGWHPDFATKLTELLAGVAG